MNERIVIVGAGGFGREVCAWIRDILALRSDETTTIAGFLDENPSALDGFDIPYTVIGDPRKYMPRESDVFVSAVGKPVIRMKLATALRDRGARFMTLVHPTAIVGTGCVLGEGAILCPYSIVTEHASLGDFVMLNVHATVGHDAVLRDGCTLSGHCDITGGVRLGRGVFAGSHAVVLPGVAVGDFAVLGAGSVVVQDVPADVTVMGVPARQIWANSQPQSAAA
jgi:sugar O-acyltransferase (sialic acid O-acetyltransferase NeuD family)